MTPPFSEYRCSRFLYLSAYLYPLWIDNRQVKFLLRGMPFQNLCHHHMFGTHIIFSCNIGQLVITAEGLQRRDKLDMSCAARMNLIIEDAVFYNKK
jgi:hypothetical protein